MLTHRQADRLEWSPDRWARRLPLRPPTWATIEGVAMADDEVVRSLARGISRYLSSRPDAVDTADGILRWWLPQLHIDARAEQLQRALDLLVARGVVDSWELPDGRRVYGRARVRPDPGDANGNGRESEG
jgi:hypothetical protein